MLLRHPWLSSLMKRPSPGAGEDGEEGEDEEEVNGKDVDGERVEDADNEEATDRSASSTKPSKTPQRIETTDKVVAKWVVNALERRNKGTSGSQERPALHAVALDAVPGSPLLDDPSTISPTR